MKNLATLLFICLSYHVQSQTYLKIKPAQNISVKSPEKVITDTVQKSSRPINRKNYNINLNPTQTLSFNNETLKPIVSAHQSNLFLINRHLTSDPDVKPAIWLTQYIDDEIVYDLDKRNAPRWEFEFIWTNIPPTATQARFEIASQPFPPTNTNCSWVKETKIIQKLATRVIGQKRKDTVQFNMSFSEKKLNLKPQLIGLGAEVGSNKSYNNQINIQERSAVKQINSIGKINSVTANTPLIQNANPEQILSNQASYGYYYVRIIALDADGNPVGRIGNTISIIPQFYEFKEPVPSSEDSLQSDYEVTAIHYVQMHEPEQEFEDCIVITDYDRSNIFLNESIIGTTQCPSPPEEPSTFEKITGNISDAGEFVFEVGKIIINGASTVYNETRDYLKEQFGKLLCDYNPAVSVLKETGANKEVIDKSCKVAAGAAFETAMSYAGIPPSIPNFDEMCQLAKGQVVDLMIQKASEASGMPCDETCKELIMQAYDAAVTSNATKNVVTTSGISYKPDPRGQYRMPYVEIEITRKSQTQKGAPIITSLAFTPQVEKDLKDLYDKDNKKTYSVKIKTDKLYKQVELPIPYLKNVGDKIKLVAVLTPKRSYFSYRCPNGAIDGIENYQQHCNGINVMESEDYDPRFTSGYRGMLDNATIIFQPNGRIQVAPDVQTQFVHHQ